MCIRDRVATVLAAPLALTLSSSLSGAGWEAQGSPSVQVRDELRADFPEVGAEAAVVVYRQDTPIACLLYTSPSPRDLSTSRMPSSA